MVDGAQRRREGWSSRRRRWTGAVALLLVALPAAVWLLRHPIATHFVDRELRRRGVEARYRITELGFGRQVLEDVVIGPVARPDLIARRVVVHTAVGLSGVGLTGLDADGVRLRAAWSGGRLRLGQVDRLLPPPSGRPFRLPDLPLRLSDARVWLATPAGRARLAVDGRGNLATRFDGRLALASDRLASGGCAAEGVRARFAVAVRDAAPTIDGPLRVAEGGCGEALRAVDLRARPRLTLNREFNRLSVRVPLILARASGGVAQGRSIRGVVAVSGWTTAFHAKATLAAAEAKATGVEADAVTVNANARGNARALAGSLDARAGRLRVGDHRAEAVTAAGHYQLALGPRLAGAFDGHIGAGAVRLEEGATRPLASLDQGLNGTPLEAPARRLGTALRTAARRFSFRSDLRVSFGGGDTELTVRRARLASASGAVASLQGAPGAGLAIASGDLSTVSLGGRLTVAGGDLPTGVVDLTRTADGAFAGVARLEPYAAGDSRVSLSPVRFDQTAGGRTSVAATAELTGPFAGGRVERARLPLALVLDRSGALEVNGACSPLSFERLTISGVTLDPARLRLCPDAGGALLRRTAAGVLTAGARIDGLALTGRIGGTPVTLDSRSARVALTEGRFELGTLRARVGAGASVTRLDLAQLSGGFRGRGGSGRFEGAAGQVAAVPIAWSRGDGEWNLADGRLTLRADLTVDDAAAPARFQTLAAPDFALGFAGSVIEAGGALVDLVTGREVTRVAIRHSFRSASGEATLAVRDLRFDDRLQPSRLTPLALGIVAEVRGSVNGDARIAWGGPAVESTGTFTTVGMDLAAAFGPVKGLSTTVRFTDLLNLVTADEQLLTVDEINPGTAVLDGQVRYAIVPGRRIAVRGGTWPFAGGRLTLEPTLLDFADGSSQSFVVDVTALDAAVLVQDLAFENIAATGVFDGRLPLVFTDGNGRVDGGRLTSRPPGGTVAYVGSVSQQDLGFFPNMAFEALKALRYDQLDVSLDGPLSGSMVTAMRFDGLAQGAGAKRNLLARAIAGLPFVFKIRITAPFRQLLSTARSFNDPTGLVEQNLGLLYEEQRRRLGDRSVEDPVQPKESEPVP